MFFFFFTQSLLKEVTKALDACQYLNQINEKYVADYNHRIVCVKFLIKQLFLLFTGQSDSPKI